MEKSPPLSTPDAIARLRSRRRFDPERPVPDALLTRILHEATLVPSAANLQPWRFLVIRDARNRRRLRACVYDRPEVVEAPVVIMVLAYHHAHRTHLEAVVDRQVALGIITPEEAAKLRATVPRHIDRLDDPAAPARAASLRAEVALRLVAESLGVATALVEEYDQARVVAAFGIPDDHSLCGVVALGYAEHDEPFQGRMALAEVCYQEHFGQPWTLGEPEGIEERDSGREIRVV